MSDAAAPLELLYPPGFYASWGRRLVAWALDTAIVYAAIVAVATVNVGDGDSVGAIAARVALLLLIPPAYHTLFNGSARGQTLGKMALGIAVRRHGSLGQLGFGRAFWRWLVTAIFWALLMIPGLIDALWPLSNPERRAWHDMAAGSVVVRL